MLTWLIIFLGCFVTAYGNAMNKLAYRRQSNMYAYEKKSAEYKAEHKPPTLMTKSYKRRAYITMAVGVAIILAGAVPLSLGYTTNDLLAMV